MQNRLLGTLLILVLATSMGQAEPPRTLRLLRVDTDQTVPLIFQDPAGQWAGFEVDVLRAIVPHLGFDDIVFREVPFSAIFEGLQRGEADVAVAGISITAAREAQVDFSQHYLESGLAIMVRRETPSLWSIWSIAFFRGEGGGAFLTLLLVVLIAAHILWWAERGINVNQIADPYFPGIFEAIWCVFATITTVGYGDIAPKNWRGRFVAVLVMFVGISYFGIAISRMVQGLSTAARWSALSTVDQLAGKRVATMAHTTSVAALRGRGAHVVEVPLIAEAYPLLTSKHVDAVVFDAPVLWYHTTHAGADTTRCVGEVFDVQYYAMALAEGNALRESLNRELLRYRESRAYTEARQRYFGPSR